MPNRAKPDTTANVNVIFHGLFLFIENNHSIDVLIPNMGQDHVVLAGTFLVEQTLDPRPLESPYFLTGIKGGTFKFQKDLNIVFNADYDHAASQDDVYARIALPTPVEIVSLRSTHDALDADIDPGGLIGGKKTRGLQVLRYHADDPNIDAGDAVSLMPHPAKLTPHPQDDPQFLNLHIFNEEDKDIADFHAIGGFDKTLKLLPTLRMSMHLRKATYLDMEAGDHFKDWGFTDIETMDSRERQQILAQAGLLWRNGTDAPSTITTGVDGSTQDCLQLISSSGS